MGYKLWNFITWMVIKYIHIWTDWSVQKRIELLFVYWLS